MSPTVKYKKLGHNGEEMIEERLKDYHVEDKKHS